MPVAGQYSGLTAEVVPKALEPFSYFVILPLSPGDVRHYTVRMGPIGNREGASSLSLVKTGSYLLRIGSLL